MKNLLNKVRQFPQEPGIYLFYDKNKELIYVGKATSLRNRVQSYFRGLRSSRPIEQMMHKVVNIKIKQTDSVLEAVILEANYIKKFLPIYNVEGKDDRSWNYVVIGDELYPRVYTIRQHELDQQSQQKQQTQPLKYIFGPYPGLKTREMMKLLQKLFFISTCKPDQKRECMYYQIGQCLGVCTAEISSREYKNKVIRPLVIFLSGGKKKLISNLETKMKKASKQENFEEAGRLRNQINSLLKIHDIALLNKSFVEDVHSDKSRLATTIQRIEGYDISNLGSTGKVGSMVVFSAQGGSALGGEYFSEKSAYRKFKIKTVQGQSDVDCLREVLERRLKHVEWRYPDVFLIDGGKPQVNAVMAILKKHKLNISLVGIAKGPERKRNDFIFGNHGRDFIKFVNENQELLIRVRDEAHRFAITYQRSLRKLKH